MKAVVDADCLIAGVLTPEGATTRLLDLWLDGDFELIVCPKLLGEVRRALRHPRVGGKYGITAEEADGYVNRLTQDGLLFDDPDDPPRAVPDDPDDDYLVALALKASADCLVTRDRHFAGVEVPRLPIYSPGAFIDRMT